MVIASEEEEVGLSYFTCAFLATRPFTTYHDILLCDLDPEVRPTFKNFNLGHSLLMGITVDQETYCKDIYTCRKCIGFVKVVYSFLYIFLDFVGDMLEERPDQAPDETETPDHAPEEAVSIDVPGSGAAIEEDYIPDLMEKEDSDSEEEGRKKRKIKKPSARQKWTQDEENELRELFKEEFERTLACPGQKRIQKKMGLSQKNNGFIFKRKRDNIKKKLSNMLMKIKSKKDFEKS